MRNPEDPSVDMHARMSAVLRGERPAQLPFITRIDFWHRHHLQCGTLPEPFWGLTTLEISRALGVGRQAALSPCSYRYHGLEVKAWFNSVLVYHEVDPVLDTFPVLDHLAPDGQAGMTEVMLATNQGALSMRYGMNADMVAAGVTSALILKHPVSSLEEARVYAHIMEQAEFIPQFDRFKAVEREIGPDGWLIPVLDRTPFQRLLLDIYGETPLFFALHDERAGVERLMGLLDEKAQDQLRGLAGLNVPYVEFNENVEGSMTNPRLFQRYCLPAYQRYADILHAQGKQMGAHTDGNLKPLVELIRECGLDVCESFTPHPLTPLTIEEAWEAWKNGPLMWGGIPSYYLEPRCGWAEMEAYVERLLALTAGGRIILGVVDAVMADNEIERLRWIADRINAAS